MIDPVTGWFEIAQYDDKKRYLSQTELKLHGCRNTLEQYKSSMTKDQNLLITSSENLLYRSVT